MFYIKKFFISKVYFYFIFIANSIYSAELNDEQFIHQFTVLVNEAKILIQNPNDLVYVDQQVYSPKITTKLKKINDLLIKRCHEKDLSSFLRNNDEIGNPILFGVNFYGDLLNNSRLTDEVIKIIQSSFNGFIGSFFMFILPQKNDSFLYDVIFRQNQIIDLSVIRLEEKINTIKNAINSLRANLEKFEGVKNEKMYDFLSDLGNDEILRNAIRLNFRDEITGGIDNLDKSKTIKNYYDEKILFTEKVIKVIEKCILVLYDFFEIPTKEEIKKNKMI